MTVSARRFYVSGRVQGVGFRYFTQRAGRAIGLAGWVRNLSDGRVEAYAAGSVVDLDAFEQRLRQGSTASEVGEVEVVEAAVDARIEGFQIR